LERTHTATRLPDPTDANGGNDSATHALLIADARSAQPIAHALRSRSRFSVTVRDTTTPPIQRGQFDVVVVDLALPDAHALVRQMRAADDKAAIVVLTGGQDQRGADGLDVEDCVALDARPEAVERCVRLALERRQLRLQLEASDARFQAIIERNVDGILIIDSDRSIRFVNPAAARLFGRNAGELAGGIFGYACVPGETTELDIVRRDNAPPIVAELRVSATTWEGEEAQLVLVRDITDRKQAEERAQRLLLERAAREQAEDSNRRSRFLVEAGATLDSSLDPEATLVNLARMIVPRVADWCMIDLIEDGRMRRVAAVHARPEKQPLLDEMRRRYPPRASSRQPSVRVMETGESVLHQQLTDVRLRALALDDDHAALLRRLSVRSLVSVPLQGRERRLGAITLGCNERDFSESDVTLAQEIGSRAGRALENARLYEAALAANRAKADFLAVMSHELRTPLNAILGYAQLMLEGITGNLENGQRRHLERIHTSGGHLLQIIEEILTFASMEAGHTRVDVQAVALHEVVDAAASMTEPLARQKGLEFVLDLHDPTAQLVTDTVKVRQILINLLTNAVKFTESGSVTLRAGLSGNDVVFTVVDTGSGIEAAAFDTIFEPFRQAERPLTRHAGGTGLGLTVSKRLSVVLGGRIDVESTPDVGSTFTVTLPTHYHEEQ
jgi:signal transduction histidine kinase